MSNDEVEYHFVASEVLFVVGSHAGPKLVEYYIDLFSSFGVSCLIWNTEEKNGFSYVKNEDLTLKEVHERSWVNKFREKLIVIHVDSKYQKYSANFDFFSHLGLDPKHLETHFCQKATASEDDLHRIRLVTEFLSISKEQVEGRMRMLQIEESFDSGVLFINGPSSNQMKYGNFKKRILEVGEVVISIPEQELIKEYEKSRLKDDIDDEGKNKYRCFAKRIIREESQLTFEIEPVSDQGAILKKCEIRKTDRLIFEDDGELLLSHEKKENEPKEDERDGEKILQIDGVSEDEWFGKSEEIENENKDRYEELKKEVIKWRLCRAIVVGLGVEKTLSFLYDDYEKLVASSWAFTISFTKDQVDSISFLDFISDCVFEELRNSAVHDFKEFHRFEEYLKAISENSEKLKKNKKWVLMPFQKIVHLGKKYGKEKKYWNATTKKLKEYRNRVKSIIGLGKKKGELKKWKKESKVSIRKEKPKIRFGLEAMDD